MLQFEVEPGTGNFIRRYVTGDGGIGLQVVSQEALAARMALMGLDDPVQVLDAMASELELPVGSEPYLPVFAAIDTALMAERGVDAPRPLRRSAAAPALPPTAPGTPPPPPVTAETVSQVPVIAEAQAQVRAMVPCTAGPRTQEQEEFAEEIRTAYGPLLQEASKEFLTDLCVRV